MISCREITFDTNDWLTSDSYDNNGNTVSSLGNSYQFDALNHLTNVNNGAVLIAYDGDGNRVMKTVASTNTYYLLDDRNPSGYVQVLEEWTASGGTTNLSCVYNYGLQLISQRQPSASTNYFVFDGHGSTRVLTDNGGSVVNAFTFDAYGNLIASNATPQTVYLYCGQQWDPDLGMYYNRARYFNPQTGRFWTMDTFEGSQSDPLSLHKYLYAADNPVNMMDPSGHEGETISTLTAIGIALNIAYLSADSVSLAKNRASGNMRGAAVDSVSVAVDMALLVIPFSGPGAGLARAGGGIIQMAAATARSAGTNIRLAWAGIRSIMMFAQATSEGGNSSGSSSGSSSSSGGGEPGSWQKVNESMRDRARAYQASITGRGAGEVYVVNGVKFDGYKGGTLLEGKGPGYGAFVGPNGKFYNWFEGSQALVDQARRQVSVSGGRAIEWHVAEPEAANAIRTLLQQNGQGAINVINTVAH